MTITSKEVKTIYSIRFTFNDFTKAFDQYEKDPLKGVGEYANAFKGLTVHDSLKDFENAFKKFTHSINHTHTINYIVKRFFKFDGVENYGFYDENKDNYRMSVYNYGDEIN